MTSASPVRHAAVLLAAGGSRRLGQPKQLLTRQGETLVRRAARLLRETAPCRLILVVGADHEAIEAAVAGVDAIVVRNRDWQAGLSTSLRAAGKALAGFDGQVLVATCDQPALDALHLQALLQGAASAPSRCAALLHDGEPGVPAIVPAGWLTQQAGGMEGDRGLGQRLRALPQASLYLLDAPDAAFDVDTDADRMIAVERGWLDR